MLAMPITRERVHDLMESWSEAERDVYLYWLDVVKEREEREGEAAGFAAVMVTRWREEGRIKRMEKRQWRR